MRIAIIDNNIVTNIILADFIPDNGVNVNTLECNIGDYYENGVFKKPEFLGYENYIELRVHAYKEESDPLYMEWQFDKSEEKEMVWRNKVLEIKTRYPKKLV